MTDEERKYKIFKIFYHNTSSKETLEELREDIIKNILINPSNYNAMRDGITANIAYRAIQKNRRAYSDIMFYYNNLLSKTSLLAKELNIDSSLELCILFTYLLWNGYFSKDKVYTFDSSSLYRIEGLYFADIMNGNGVCLNNSDMLKDLLNICGYNSSILLNHYNNAAKIDSILKIKRRFKDEEKNYLSKILKEISTLNKANHTFNLVEENGKLYIYDPTNMILQRVVNKYKSEMINGTGTHKIYPYESYFTCAQKKEYTLLDRFIKGQDYISPYSIHDLIAATEVNLEIIERSISLVEDYYSEVRPYIISISKENSKILRREK